MSKNTAVEDLLEEIRGNTETLGASMTEKIQENRRSADEHFEKLAEENAGFRQQLEDFQKQLEERSATVPGLESEAKKCNVTGALRALEGGKLRDSGLMWEQHQEFIKQNEEEIGRRLEQVGLSRSLLNTLSDGKGGLFLADEMMGEFWDNTFRDTTVLGSAGVTTISPKHTLKIPRKTGNTTAYRRGEAEAVSASSASFGILKLEPKGIGARTKLTLEQMVFGDGRLEEQNRRDLLESVMLKMDLDAIYGTPGENTPTGLVNTTGVNDVDLHSGTGADLTWDDVQNMVQLLRDRRAMRPGGNYRFLGRSRAFFGLMTQRLGGSTVNDGDYVWRPGMKLDDVLPYPHLTREDYPANAGDADSGDVFFGDMRPFIHARYGGILILESNVATDGSFNALTQGGKHYVVFTWDDVGYVTPSSMLYTSAVNIAV